jgi:cell shape-determining protein MreC
MTDPTGRERIGQVLQALAADLATEQRRVMRLRRENRELRAQLAALQQKHAEASESDAPEQKLEAVEDTARARRSTRPSA